MVRAVHRSRRFAPKRSDGVLDIIGREDVVARSEVPIAEYTFEYDANEFLVIHRSSLSYAARLVNTGGAQNARSRARHGEYRSADIARREGPTRKPTPRSRGIPELEGIRHLKGGSGDGLGYPS